MPNYGRFVILSVLACSAILLGCSEENPGAAGDGNGNPPNTAGDHCDPANPVEGCTCGRPGETAECGAVHQQSGDEVVCSMGHVQCLPTGKWGPCTGERIVVKSMSVHTNGLGSPGACADPCTPNCATVKDDPSGGLVVPSGMTTDGGGLQLEPVPPPPNTCTAIEIKPDTAPATDIIVTSTTTQTTKLFNSKLLPVGCNPYAPSPLWYTDKFDVAQMDDAVPGKLTVVVPIAQTITVGAKLGSFTDTVTANIKVQVQENGANTPPAGITFTQFPAELPADPTDTNLTILYPYTDTVLPLGLLAPLVQWRNNGANATGGVVVTLQYPATGTPIFQVSQLVTESMKAPVPLRNAQPRHVIPQDLWFAFEQTVHRNRGTYGDTARISIRRRVGTTTYKAKSIDVRIAPGQLKGRIYYNSYGTALVNNYSGAKQSTGGAFPGGAFGAATLVIPPGAATPTVAAGFNGSGGCHVCHSASADGATLVTGDEGHVAKKYTFPGTAPNGGTSFGSKAMIFGGINPNSTRMFSSSGAYEGDSTSRLFDINHNVITSNVPTKLKAHYPSFATDGSGVVFVYGSGDAKPLSNDAADRKKIAMMSFNGNATFSNFRTLTTASAPTVWPAFLPAGQNGVVYQVETRTNTNGGYSETRHDCECSSYSGTTGELWWVSTGTTPQATRLHRLNGYDAAGTNGVLPSTPTTGHSNFGDTNGPAGAGFYEQRYNYEPTVLPQVIGGYSWVIFTSRRAYGNVATINPYASDPRFDDISIDPTPKKMWIAAIANAPSPGTDPSFPAFYLPGQELIAGNSRAVFALEACHPAVASNPGPANLCDSDLDCCGAPSTASCTLDPPPLANPPVKHCISTSSNVCRAVGQSCLTTSQCCNAASGGVCSNGVCADPPPYYSDQSYTRVYDANCAAGTVVKWGLFEWRTETPTGTRIDFSAQVGDGTTWSPTTPTAFGTAQGATIAAPNWGTNGVPISTVLGLPLSASAARKLKITMAFKANTDRTKTPVLNDWRQSIQCVPYE